MARRKNNETREKALSQAQSKADLTATSISVYQDTRYEEMYYLTPENHSPRWFDQFVKTVRPKQDSDIVEDFARKPLNTNRNKGEKRPQLSLL